MVHRLLFGTLEHSVIWGGDMRSSQNYEIVVFSVKKKTGIQYFVWAAFSLSSISRIYFEILSYLECGEKIIKPASKNSMKLGPKINYRNNF